MKLIVIIFIYLIIYSLTTQTKHRVMTVCLFIKKNTHLYNNWMSLLKRKELVILYDGKSKPSLKKIVAPFFKD